MSEPITVKKSSPPLPIECCAKTVPGVKEKPVAVRTSAAFKPIAVVTKVGRKRVG